MGHPVEQNEIGKHLTVEQRLKIELDKSLTGQAYRVTQEPQLASIGDDSPEMVV